MHTTFLTEDQVWGDSALDVIKQYGSATTLSDLAIVLGGLIGDTITDGKKQHGFFWTQSHSDSVYGVRIALDNGKPGTAIPVRRKIAIRPALTAQETSKIMQGASTELSLPNGSKVQVAEYGEYPQTIAPKRISAVLENNYKNKILKTTGKTYTFDTAKPTDWNTPLKPLTTPEYTLGRKKYIRITGNPADRDSILSNNQIVKTDQPYWIEVQPIEWLADKSGVWVAKQALIAGIHFDKKLAYDDNFETTVMADYLKKHFNAEIVASKLHEKKKFLSIFKTFIQGNSK